MGWAASKPGLHLWEAQNLRPFGTGWPNLCFTPDSSQESRVPARQWKSCYLGQWQAFHLWER